jgi:hypothetical protein
MGKGGGGGSSQVQQFQQIAAVQQAQQAAANNAAAQAQAAAAASSYTPPTPQGATPSAATPTQYMPSPQAMEAARNAFNAKLRGQEASILGGTDTEVAGLTQEERDRRRKAKLTPGESGAATQTAANTASPATNTYTGTTLGG